MEMLKVKLVILSFFFMLVSSADESVEKIEVFHSPNDELPKTTDVELDLAAEINHDIYDVEIVDLANASVLSITPMEGYVIKGVKEADKSIFACDVEDLEDGIYAVVVFEDATSRYVTVFSERGISCYIDMDGKYNEIKDYEKVPKDLMEVMPLKYEDGSFHPVCGNQNIGDDENYGHLASKAGNLSGTDSCALI